MFLEFWQFVKPVMGWQTGRGACWWIKGKCSCSSADWRGNIRLNLNLGFKQNKWEFSKLYHVISQIKPMFLTCQHSILIQRTFSWLFSQAAKNVLSVPNKESASKQNEVEKFEVREQNKSKTEAKWKYKVTSPVKFCHTVISQGERIVCGSAHAERTRHRFSVLKEKKIKQKIIY